MDDSFFFKMLQFTNIKLIPFFLLLTFYPFEIIKSADPAIPKMVEIQLKGHTLPREAEGKYFVKSNPTVAEFYYFVRLLGGFNVPGGFIQIHRTNKTGKYDIFRIPCHKGILDGKGGDEFTLKNNDIVNVVEPEF